MNCLRSAPLRPLLVAEALQSFIRCCCGVAGFAPVSAANAGAAITANSSAASILVMRSSEMAVEAPGTVEAGSVPAARIITSTEIERGFLCAP